MSTPTAPAPSQVLVAEDCKTTRSVLSVLLRTAGHEPVMVADGARGLAMLLAQDGPDLAILDWNLPILSGPEICRRVRATQKLDRYVYLILLTAHTSPEKVAEGLDAGADDYIDKAAGVEVIRARLRTGTRMLRLMRELAAAREALRVQATRDGLTGLWNRGAVLDLLDGETLRAERSGRDVALLLFDLDHFKSINDTHGHLVGDDVLRGATERLSRAMRGGEHLGRVGGEEFLAVVSVETEAQATLAAERLRTTLADAPIETRIGPLHVTASVGVSSLRRERTRARDALLGAADQALYAAKRGGRNRVASAWAGEANRRSREVTQSAGRRASQG